MEKSKILWLDVDGVLLDWVRPFLKYIKSPVSYEDLKQYDLSFLFGGDTNRMVSAINEFNATRAYAQLEPLVSREDLQRLKDRGYELRVITQVDGHTQRFFRLENLVDAFGPRMISGVRFSRRGEKKAETLRSLNPYNEIEIIEDNPVFFEDAERVGGFKAMAIRHPYNAKELKDVVSKHGCAFPIYTGMPEAVRHLCAY
jgi:hypothetical protein